MKIKFNYADPNKADAFTNYQRELSLDKAIASTTFEVGGVTYKREYFTSFGNDVSIIKLSADKPGQLNFSIALSREENAVTI